MLTIRYAKSLPVYETDVLVCGLGCAGLAAAVAAGRMGASTMGVERWPCAGGNITAANVPGTCGLADMTTGELAVGGIALELLGRSGVIKLPLASRKLFEPMLDEKKIKTAFLKLPYLWDVERLKIVADQVLAESNVKVLYHSWVADVKAARGRIGSVIIFNVGGGMAVRPKVVIDCTGDGDVACWAGAPFDVDERRQPMTTEFHITNVRVPEARQELQNKCAVVLQAARQEGRMGIYGGPYLGFPAPGIVRVNAVRLPYNSAVPEEITQAEIEGRRDAWRMYELWKERLPEFRDACLFSSGPACGARESRRIRGLYTLTEADVRAARPFEDAIVKGSWYLDRHPLDSPGYHPHDLVKAYDIPYRTLLPQGVENLLVAGRCHSATSEALASSRVGTTAMGMGEAAGVAAAMAVQTGIAPREVSVPELRRRLVEQGGVL